MILDQVRQSKFHKYTLMKRNYRVAQLLTTLALASLLGCATSYQKKGFTGGFKEAVRGRNQFTVGFNGNGYTSTARAADLCLLRCAELTLGHGFSYFVLTDNRDNIDTSTSVTSGTYGGGLMFSTTQSIPKPSTVNTILCFRGKPYAFNNYFDAARVFADLSSKYGVTKSPEHLQRLNDSKALMGISFEMTDGFTMGQRVRGFVEGSMAEQAGIKIGDTVIALNGISMKERDAIRSEAGKWKAGDIVEVTVERGMKKITVPVKTVFNDHGIRFRSLREELGNLPPIEQRQVVVVEGGETSFTYVPIAEYLDYENPLVSMDQFKEIAVRAAAIRGANVVHILSTRSEANQYFGKSDNNPIGFVSGLLYAPPATLGVTYETGVGYEKRRIIRRVLVTPAQEAGLRIGDNILALNGIDVLSLPAISKEIIKWRVGDPVEVTVARDGKELKLLVKASPNEISPPVVGKDK